MVQDTSAKAASRLKSSRRLRGSRACECCHTRKVRCDIDLNGPGKPCTNCRLDGQVCVSYRGSKACQDTSRPAAKAEDAVRTPVTAFGVHPRTDAAQEFLLTDSGDQRHSERLLIPKQSPCINADAAIDMQVSDLWMQARSGMTTPLGRIAQLSAFNKHRPNLIDIPRLRFGELSTSRGLDDHITFSYYDFLNLKSLSRVQPDDVRYLEFTGSLHIPTRPVLDEFVREYFRHVHPVLPVVDEKAFWTMYEDSTMDTGSPGRLSLFVFQSMLFAASATVPLEVLRCCGFNSVRQARETFYRRAKTIFDLSKENDYYAVAQGAILLTYYTTNSDPNMNSQWLSIAIQNARVINAQLYHRDQSLSDFQRRSKKRLWWSCILRDRVMPLGTRRAVQITHEHFDFSQRFNEEDLEHEIGFSRVYDADTQRQLLKTVVAQCHLAVVLTGVLSTCYPLDGSHSLSQFSPPNLETTKERIKDSRLKLINWFTDFSLQTSLQTDKTRCHVSVTLYTNLLYIYYHSARLALCQYEILVLESYLESADKDNTQCLHNAKLEMRSATGAITEIVKALIWLKVAQYLPISAVAYTALPLVLTALDLKMSSDVTQAISRRRQLEVYIEAMRLYRKKYDGTEQVSAVIERLLSEVIERLLSDAEPGTRRICSSANNKTSQKSLVLASKPKDWLDILNQRPKLYLRMILALDMAFARGKFPEEADFPTSYRIAEVEATSNQDSFCSEKTLSRDYLDVTMPCMQPTHLSENSDDFHAPHHAAGETYVNLDFADLFAEHRERSEYDNPWMEDVQNLFDMGFPV